jgi:hypothetical protein
LKHAKKKVGFLKKLQDLGRPSRSSSSSRRAPPSPPPERRGARRKNGTREASPPPPSPPAAEEEDEEHGGGEDEEHGGGEDEEHGGGEDEEDSGGEDEEDGGGEDEEDLSEDEGLGGLPFEPDPSLVWEPPEDEGYVPCEERLQPRDRKPYQRGKTQLPKLQTWSSSDVVLVPSGRRYMLLLTFRYRNFIIIEIFMTYILILPFHCAGRSSLATRRGSRHVATPTSLEAYLGSISPGLSISLVVAAT